MMPYLIEPYNAYQKPPKKKHWMEIAEEEALMARIIAEQLALQEAKSAQMTVNDSVLNGPSCDTLATPAIGAAGGGIPPYAYFHPEQGGIGFTASPKTGPAYLVVQFTNTTPTQFGEVNTYNWSFGDGQTSTFQHPTHIFSNTQSYDIKLGVTSSLGELTQSIYVAYISASIPVLSASLSPNVTKSVAPFTASFTNNTFYNGGLGIVHYTMSWGDGTATTGSTNDIVDVTTTMRHIYQTGSFTSMLSATESIFNFKSEYTFGGISASIPTLTASFTMTTSSLIGPVTAAFAAVIGYNGEGTLTGSWNMGDGVILGYPAYTGFNYYYTNTGSYTASFGVTESRYNITSSVYTASFSSSKPSVSNYMTLVTSSAVGPVTGTFQVSHSYNGSGTVQGYLYWGDGGFMLYNNPAMASQSYKHGYSNTGSYTASFALTESYYNITTSLITASFSASKPVITASLTSSIFGITVTGFTSSFTGSHQYDSIGSVVGTFVFGNGTTGDYGSNRFPKKTYLTGSGGSGSIYTASLSVTESIYNLSSSVMVYISQSL